MADKKSARREQEEQFAVEAIEKMNGTDKTMGLKLHEIIKKNAPNLHPKTWYGMPSYANDEGKVVIFFRNAERFNDRYLTFGFNDRAKLDDGNMWPTNFAITKIDAEVEKKVAELVKKAVS